MAKKKKNFRKGFRKNKRVRHPAYVFDEKSGKLLYIGITHAPKVKEEENIPLKKNPNPQDDKQAFARPKVEEDEPKNFGRAMKDWKLSEEDKKTINTIIENSQKKE